LTQWNLGAGASVRLTSGKCSRKNSLDLGNFAKCLRSGSAQNFIRFLIKSMTCHRHSGIPGIEASPYRRGQSSTRRSVSLPIASGRCNGRCPRESRRRRVQRTFHSAPVPRFFLRTIWIGTGKPLHPGSKSVGSISFWIAISAASFRTASKVHSVLDAKSRPTPSVMRVATNLRRKAYPYGTTCLSVGRARTVSSLSSGTSRSLSSAPMSAMSSAMSKNRDASQFPSGGNSFRLIVSSLSACRAPQAFVGSTWLKSTTLRLF
jgi:hypothetical protein